MDDRTLGLLMMWAAGVGLAAWLAYVAWLILHHPRGRHHARPAPVVYGGDVTSLDDPDWPRRLPPPSPVPLEDFHRQQAAWFERAMELATGQRELVSAE